MTERARESAGKPTGGRYAAQQHGEADDVTLQDPRLGLGVNDGWHAAAARSVGSSQDSQRILEKFAADQRLVDDTFRIVRESQRFDDRYGVMHRLGAQSAGHDVQLVAREELRVGDIVITERDKEYEYGTPMVSTSSSLYVVMEVGERPPSRSQVQMFRVMTTSGAPDDAGVVPSEVGWSQSYDAPSFGTGCALYRVRPKAG